MDSPKPSFSRKWVLACAAVLVVLLVAGGIFAYFAFYSAPDSPLVLKSFALSDAGKTSQAEAVAKQAITASAKDSEAYRALGYAQETEQNYAAAHLSYQKSIALYGRNALAYYDDAYTFFLEGNLPQAEAEYRVAIKFDPNLSVAHGGLAQALFDNKDFNGALTEFKTAYSLAHNSHEKAVWAYSISQTLLNKSNFADALTYAKEATTLDPKYAEGWYGLGTALFSQVFATSSGARNTPVAVRTQTFRTTLSSYDELNKATSLDPNLAQAYFQTGIELYYFGQPSQGAKFLDKASAVLPRDTTLSSSERTELLTEITRTRQYLQVIFPKIK